MGFSVKYDAPAAIVGGAAYVGGLGDFAQRQQQVALQQQELAQRDLQQRRAIDAQQQSQMFGAQQDAIDRQFRLGMLGQQQQFEAQQFDQRMGAQAELASEEDRRAFIMERYRNKEWKLNDASKRRLHEINNRMSEVRMDPKLTPDERSRALSNLDAEHWGILGSPAPMVPGEEEPTPDEVAGSNAFYHKWPDGTVTKGFIENRNGAPTFREIKDEMLTQEAKLAEQQHKAMVEQQKADEKLRLDREKARIAADAAKVKARDEQNKRVQDYYAKIATEMVPATDAQGNVIMDGGGKDSTTAATPRQRLRKPEEVRAMVDAFRAGLVEAEVPMPNLIEMGPAPSMPSDPINEIVMGMAGQGMPPPAPQQPPAPQPMAGPDRFAPAPNHGYLPEQQQPQRQSQADPELMALAQEAGIPVMASPEEAMKLPPGTKFLTPDGQILERP